MGSGWRMGDAEILTTRFGMARPGAPEKATRRIGVEAGGFCSIEAGKPRSNKARLLLAINGRPHSIRIGRHGATLRHVTGIIRVELGETGRADRCSCGAWSQDEGCEHLGALRATGLFPGVRRPVGSRRDEGIAEAEGWEERSE